jgi:hypothetical protein
MSKFCANPGCTGIAETGRFCPPHTGNNYETAKNRTRREPWYDRAAWDVVRSVKLQRSPMCEIEDCRDWASDVHHLDDSWRETRDWSLFIGGLNMSNLQALCHRHHSEITMSRNRSRGAL